MKVKSGIELHKVIYTQRKQNFPQLNLLESAIWTVADQSKQLMDPELDEKIKKEMLMLPKSKST